MTAPVPRASGAPPGGYRGSGHRCGPAYQPTFGAADRLPPPSRPEPLRLRLTGAVWLAVWELTRRLPEALVFGLADLGGRFAHRASGPARARVARNLARVLPDVSEAELAAAVRGAFRSYARYWVEAFRAADLDPADLDARTTTDGFAHLDAALEGGRGVVVLLAHHGSWDVAGRWAETHGYHLAVVAEIIRPRKLFQRFVRLREAVGVEVVPLRRRSASAPDGGATLAGSLERVAAGNHLLGLLADRDLSGNGLEVALFGELAPLPRGPASLSQRTGAPIVPISMLQRPGRRWHLQVLPAVQVDGLAPQAAAARVAQALEQLVGLDPVQWHCFSPIWSADRPPRSGRHDPVAAPP